MVSVITLNYNQNSYTLNCLESLLKSDYKDFQITLIDNGSSIENFKSLRENIQNTSRIKIHRLEENIGYVGGINFGLKESEKLNPSFILILNNDTVVDANSISELISTCKKYNNKAIVTGKVYHFDDPDRIQDIGYSFKNEKALEFNKIGFNEIDIGQYDNTSERDMIDDIFWLFPFDLYSEIGGYSTYFWFNAEQADFVLRAKNIGYKLIFAPNAKLWHKGSVSIGGRDKNPKMAYWHVQSTLIFRYIHLNKILFLKQYFKIVISIILSYFKSLVESIKGDSVDFSYPNAKLQGWLYFNKWYFIRNKNDGYNPFDNKLL